jgi:hypothetical protein
MNVYGLMASTCPDCPRKHLREKENWGTCLKEYFEHVALATHHHRLFYTKVFFQDCGSFFSPGRTGELWNFLQSISGSRATLFF